MGVLVFLWNLPEKEILVYLENLEVLEKKLGAVEEPGCSKSL